MIYEVIMLLIVLESGGDNKAIGDKGKAFGCLQIHEKVIKDVNRIYGMKYTHHEAFDRKSAIEICTLYLSHYGKVYKKKTGLEPTKEIYIQIWQRGPTKIIR